MQREDLASPMCADMQAIDLDLSKSNLAEPCATREVEYWLPRSQLHCVVVTEADNPSSLHCAVTSTAVLSGHPGRKI